MRKKINILLVDDNKTTNYYNRKIIKTYNKLSNIYEVYNGSEALIFLEKKECNLDLILLDINMPIMDGFEFLQEYSKLPNALKLGVKIGILTTSTWVSDKRKAENNKNLISGFFEKPLKKETLEQLL